MGENVADLNRNNEGIFMKCWLCVYEEYYGGYCGDQIFPVSSIETLIKCILFLCVFVGAYKRTSLTHMNNWFVGGGQCQSSRHNDRIMTHKDSDTNGQLHTKRARHSHLETHRHIHRLPIPHKQENTETRSARHTHKTLTQTHSPGHPHSYPSINEASPSEKNVLESSEIH